MHACVRACLRVPHAQVQAATGGRSRGRLQIVAGERQNSNVSVKRKLGGGTGLPPIDGGVRGCCAVVVVVWRLVWLYRARCMHQVMVRHIRVRARQLAG
jgi:hypothetical protein